VVGQGDGNLPCPEVESATSAGAAERDGLLLCPGEVCGVGADGGGKARVAGRGCGLKRVAHAHCEPRSCASGREVGCTGYEEMGGARPLPAIGLWWRCWIIRTWCGVLGR
jgi:hypothetical protein